MENPRIPVGCKKDNRTVKMTVLFFWQTKNATETVALLVAGKIRWPAQPC
jgi:hypothetical protein